MDRKRAKKNTKKVRKLNLKRVFLLVLIIALIVLLVKLSFKIKLSNIIVNGNHYVLENKIIEYSNLSKSSSFLEVDETSVCTNVLKEPLIASCTITKKLDFSIIITVSENYPLFYYNETNSLMLSNGKEYNVNNTFGVPNIINYVPNKILSSFIDGLKGINGDIIRSISEIEYAPSLSLEGTYIDEERFMLSMRDGNVVYINIKNIAILNTYNKIYASNGDKKGYYNLDSDYGIYYFKEFESK